MSTFQHDITEPLGLVIDYKEERLYWVDYGKGVVESIALNGKDRLQMFTVDQAKFFGITLYKKFIFATDQRENQLYVFDRQRMKHEVNFRVGAKPYDVMMYDDDVMKAGSCKCYPKFDPKNRHKLPKILSLS